MDLYTDLKSNLSWNEGPHTAPIPAEPAGIERKLTIDQQRVPRSARGREGKFLSDPAAFDGLAQKILPDLLARHPVDVPFRVWVHNCGRGEDVFTLAILLSDAITQSGRDIRFRILASDEDPLAIAAARAGLYPHHAVADLDPDRISRFFTPEVAGFRVRGELRRSILYMVQSRLNAPFFSHANLIACRNGLSAFDPRSQDSLTATFSRVLDRHGVLWTGEPEPVLDASKRFAAEAGGAFYRHANLPDPGEGRSPGDHAVRGTGYVGEGGDIVALQEWEALARSMAAATDASAAVLVDAQCMPRLYVGPVERYLDLSTRRGERSVIDMLPPEFCPGLDAAIATSLSQDKRVDVPLPRGDAGDGGARNIVIHHLRLRNRSLALVCFPTWDGKSRPAERDFESDRAETLEREVASLRAELDTRDARQKSIEEEHAALLDQAVSLIDELQQSNTQFSLADTDLRHQVDGLVQHVGRLQAALEFQRRNNEEMRNLLDIVDQPTLFLDGDLKIRLFTKAMRAIFGVRPQDIGRPLDDLRPLAPDDSLIPDATAVLHTRYPISREIQAHDGTWYSRKIRTYGSRLEEPDGVVVSFVDITDQKRRAEELKAAKQAEKAAARAKSQGLAAISHDLRQPLQSLNILSSMLSKCVTDERGSELLSQVDRTLSTMSSMLDVLTDIRRINSGEITPKISDAPVNVILKRLRDEFTYVAAARGLCLRVLPSNAIVTTDPQLLEAILRNLLANAIKYTPKGKVLIGCRRRESGLEIQVLDTGIGISASELPTIFDEFEQVASGEESGMGFGLGLAIVRKLAAILNHTLDVSSESGLGSVFSVTVPFSARNLRVDGARFDFSNRPIADKTAIGEILLVEGDADLRRLLCEALKGAGHYVLKAADAKSALDLVRDGPTRPDLILVDQDLPGDMSGVELVNEVRAYLGDAVDAVILAADPSYEAFDGVKCDCERLGKPVRVEQILDTIARLLPPGAPGAQRVDMRGYAQIPWAYIVDKRPATREGLKAILSAAGFSTSVHADEASFLSAYRPAEIGCLILGTDDDHDDHDAAMALLHELRRQGGALPVVMIADNGDVAFAVEAIKAGAFEFIEKPIGRRALIDTVKQALENAENSKKRGAWGNEAAHQIAALTPRQREIMDAVLAGHPSKVIAAKLGISQRTVEAHRAAIMAKTGATSLPALARLAVAASLKAGGGYAAAPAMPTNEDAPG
ncbi:response regulator [Acuticoccus sp. M5D2P5]|uniref:CheR family methyltransferase n=1 Tax=Acuticoccus kalidii TaxID=2910977 RepID=UPI001F1ACD4C|nr:CheR family methyltransferase [Acuticoccus kalidii]MCF3935176.1 response regulator [Acuticoccus kalidii]